MTGKRILAWLVVLAMAVSAMPVLSFAGAEDAPSARPGYVTDYMMKITTDENDIIGQNDNAIDYRYLSYRGVDLMMYNNGYNMGFGDEHNSGIVLLLHGERVGANGDIHLLPVPEQWDAATPATSSTRQDMNGVGWNAPNQRVYDTATNTITTPMKYVYEADPLTNENINQLDYELIAVPEAGGFELRVVLEEDLPEALAGSAAFNFELIPSLYMTKSFQADSDNDGAYDAYGIFPRAAEDEFNYDWPRADIKGNAWYVEQWNDEKGDAQPAPFTQGYGFSIAPEDGLHHMTVRSDNLISIYDGRNRSQNGWFTMSSKIAVDAKAGDTVASWHFKVPVQENWIRPVNIAHAQTGYGTGLQKVAVMETDENDANPPPTAKLLKLQGDGSFVTAFEGNVAEPIKWARYNYRDFDFSGVKTPGIYAIEYDGVISDAFPIADNVYDKTWELGLSVYLATAMDHMALREGYRIWHGAAHMDDARMGEHFANSTDSVSKGSNTTDWAGSRADRESIQWFDMQGVGLSLPPQITAKGLKPGDRIENLAQGGWFDAGDFDIEIPSNMNVLGNLIRASEAFNEMDGHDTLSVEWAVDTGGMAEMHRPDGIPDVVQQVKHGAMQIRAEIEEVGYNTASTVEVPTLRQYTHLGEGSTDTDGYIYDPALKENEIVERDGKVYSGKNDDRMYMIMKNRVIGGAAGSWDEYLINGSLPNLAGAAYVLQPYYADFAQECFVSAEKVWNTEVVGKNHETMTDLPQGRRGEVFNSLVQLILAANRLGLTDKEAYYTNKINELIKIYTDGLATPEAAFLDLSNPFVEIPTAKINAQFPDDRNARTRVSSYFIPLNTYYSAAYIKDIMGQEYSNLMVEAVKSYIDGTTFDEVANQPFGFTESYSATWGNAGNKSGVGVQAANLIKCVDGINHGLDLTKLENAVIRSVNYIFGTHPYNSTSWMTGAGMKSHKYPYNSNRADNGFIAGSVVPGYIMFKPDFPETLDNFQFLWGENEATIGQVAGFLPAAKMAEELANKKKASVAPTTVEELVSDLTFTATETPRGANQLPYATLKSSGFDVVMYNTMFSGVFGDQHWGGVELIQNGSRIATNGDIHLLPTPEQWDATPAPRMRDRRADTAANNVSVSMVRPKFTFPNDPNTPANESNDINNYPDSATNMGYTIKAEPEAGGSVKLTVTVANLPADLKGQAGFNLDFMPSQYKEKSYQAATDRTGVYDQFGVFSLLPYGEMKETDRVWTEGQANYVKEWNVERGDYQPEPLVTGQKMLFAAEEQDHRLQITSDTGAMSLYDGRNRAQNGWFVLREIIPADGVMVWHIKPDGDSAWTREPNVGVNQAGYGPDQTKVSVIELDPKYNAPATATVERLNADGTYTPVFTGNLTAAKNWSSSRYQYREFDFSSVSTPGIYAINYDGTRTEIFPIAQDAYDKLWQASMSGFLAKNMDHIYVRDNYKVFHAASHMDDAIAYPLVGDEFRDYNHDGVKDTFDGTWFDGMDLYDTSRTNASIQSLQRIAGLNKGGWYDAGDFDIQTSRNHEVIEHLAIAYQQFAPQYDTMDVTWDDTTGGYVELHRPDGTPDIIQQVKHGAMQILAQYEAVGYNFSVLEVPTLRQYTHLGDGSRDTDGYVYDPTLGENDRDGLRSGKFDDRLARIGVRQPSLQYTAAASLAAAYYVTKGYDVEFANKCLAAAETLWKEERDAGNTATSNASLATSEFRAAVQLVIATQGQNAEYVEAVETIFPLASKTTNNAGAANYNNFSGHGWKAVLALDYMEPSFNSALRNMVAEYRPWLDASLQDMPYGVPPTTGAWGNSDGAMELGMRMYYLHEAYPELIGTDYTVRAANFIMGTHPDNNTSYVSGVGTSSIESAYGSNRADDTFIHGGIVPGYVTISPDLPEIRDDFGMMWFESEYVIDSAALWVNVGNALSRIARLPAQTTPPSTPSTNDDPPGIPGGSSGGSSTTSPSTSTPSVSGPTLSQTEVIYEPGAGVSVTLDAASGVTVDTVTLDDTELESGVDYTIEDGEIVIADELLSTLEPGTYVFTFTLSDGKELTLEVTIEDEEQPLGALEMPFTDVLESDWFYGDVEYVYTTGLMLGTSDTTFEPNTSVTRGMIVTVLYRNEGSPDVTDAENPFDDVADGEWYTDAVKWAADNGIVLGFGDGTYMPEQIVTREDLATILTRYMTYKEWNLPETRNIVIFADEADIADYAKAAVQTLFKLGVINGVGENTIAPQADATRAEFAAMLHRLITTVEDRLG